MHFYTNDLPSSILITLFKRGKDEIEKKEGKKEYF